jgi:alpha-glucosidase
VREHPDGSVLVVARRAAAPGFTLPLAPGRHVLGSEPGGADLTSGPDGVEVPATDGPRVDIWALDVP